MVLFARLLRVGGLDLTPAQVADWVSALKGLDLWRRDDVKNSARALFVRRREDLDWFELAFDLFWQARDPRQLAELELGLLVQRQTEKTRRSVLEPLSDGSDAGAREEEVAVYSDQEVLRKKDFAELSATEHEAVKQLMGRLRFQLGSRRTRRFVAARRGERPHLRRALRQAAAKGGEILALPRRTRKEKRRPLTLLCDVSGSMEAYSRLLLHFVYGLSHQDSALRGLERVEAFTFGTRLTRITQALRESDVDRALSQASREIADWGGGTRTGEALKEFNHAWSRRVLGQGAVVLIISDGWDRGDIELLAREMGRLKRSCHRLIWLNPLLGSPRYQPLTRGMQAALPFVDDFLPVHNLESLEQLAQILESLPQDPGRRRDRRAA